MHTMFVCRLFKQLVCMFVVGGILYTDVEGLTAPKLKFVSESFEHSKADGEGF